MRIFTIGYEAATMPDFLAALAAAGVGHVIDVRALPLSRRPGFSKNPLKGALADKGIDYVHLRPLGTPPEGREAARKGRHADLKRTTLVSLSFPKRSWRERKCSCLRRRSRRHCCVTSAS